MSSNIFMPRPNLHNSSQIGDDSAPLRPTINIPTLISTVRGSNVNRTNLRPHPAIRIRSQSQRLRGGIKMLTRSSVPESETGSSDFGTGGKLP